MALDKTRLVVGPTFNDNEGRSGSVFVDSQGATEAEISSGILTLPVSEGQLKVERIAGSTSLCRLLCSVETSEGIYEWKQVQVVTKYIDTRTGRDWDPNAKFIYSYSR